jgi:hypothetical protein
MAIQPAVHANRYAHWNHKFEEALKDKRINALALTIISAIGTFLLMQGFLSPARDVDGKEFSQISYRDISPIALATSITSLIYIWPILSLVKKSGNPSPLLCGTIFGALFPLYRLAFCLHTQSPPVETMDAIAACKQFFIENQEKYFLPECLIHPLKDYLSFCEVSMYELPQNIQNCLDFNYYKYQTIAPVDRYNEYQRCLPTSQFMASDITQFTILAINGVVILLGLMKLGIQLKNCSRRRHLYESINV